MIRLRPRDWAALGCCVLFLGLGILILPWPGIQNDEALFAGPLYHPATAVDWLEVGRVRIPLMLISYLGCLKTWLYAPIFKLIAPSVWSLRLPPLIAGAITIWLFYRLTDRIAGSRAALAGSLLLAVDPSFLVTNCLDWGPVALQHLLLVGSMAALVRFHDTGSTRWLAIGFVFLGLGLWDKALFAWALAGMCAGVIVVAPSAVRKSLTVRNIGIALAALCLGALPLVVHNLRLPAVTARENLALAPDLDYGKVRMLRTTLDGSGLFGYIVSDTPGPRIGKAPAWSKWISERTGRARGNFNDWAFLGALLLSPWLIRSSRTFRFGIVFIVVAWLLMAMARGTGGSTHHSVLLWPIPQMAIAVALAEVSRLAGRHGRLILVVAVALLAGASLAVVNQHYLQWREFGATGSWSDAIVPLKDSLVEMRAAPAVIIDWGIFDALVPLSRGKLPLQPALDSFNAALFSQTDALFVGYTDEFQQFEGVNDRFRKSARAAGYEPQLLRTIQDRHGRAVFEIQKLATRR